MIDNLDRLPKLDLSMWEYDDEYNLELEYANYKHELRKKGYVPVLKFTVLNVYKINPNLDDLYYLSQKYRSMFTGEKYKLVCMTPDLHNNICKDENIENLIRWEPATYEKIIEKFNLVDDKNKKEFMRLYFNMVGAKVTKDDNDDTKFKNMMSKIIEENYAICSFKVESKLERICDYMCEGYIDLDFLLGQLYEFFYSDSISFYTRINNLENDVNKIQMVSYTNKEKGLSDSEKIEIIKELLYASNIECVYTSELSNISYKHIELLFGNSSAKFLYDFAHHNNNAIHNEKIQTIIDKLHNSKVKCIKK